MEVLSTLSNTAVRDFQKDELRVKVFDSRDEMGRVAAIEAAQRIKELLAQKDEVNIIFAAAPSQNDFFQHLIQDEEIAWNRVNAFHMDEYIGLKADAPQAFGNFLKDRLFSKLPLKQVFYFNSEAASVEQETYRYADLLSKHPVDVVCLGIGENGHIAFNDPPIADFKDPVKVKVVKLDEMSRQQQVNDKCFNALSEVPTHAWTLTIPALLSAGYLFCIVPAPTKAKAVFSTLNDEISEVCPATILRTKENTILYLDDESSKLL